MPRRRDLVAIDVDDMTLTVRPLPSRLRRAPEGVSVPARSVVDVKVAEGWTLPARVGLRRTVSGTFGAGEKRAFWLIRKGRRALVVELDGGGYTRLVVEVADPDAAAARLRRTVPSLR